MFQFLAANFQVVIFLIIFLAPVIGRIMSKLNEQAKIKRLRDQQERAKLEALRTGRATDSRTPAPAARASAPVAQAQSQAQAQTRTQTQAAGAEAPRAPQQADRARLQELARRRQAQIERLKQQRADTRAPASPASAPGQTPATPPAPPARRSTVGGTGPITPIPTRSGVPQTPPRATPPTTQTPSKRRREPKRSGIAPPTPSTLAASFAAPPRAKPRAPKAPPRSGLGPIAGMSRDEIRRAIVLSEVLAPPVSLRQSEASS